MAGDDRESESACDGFLDGFVAAEGQANLGFETMSAEMGVGRQTGALSFFAQDEEYLGQQA